MLLIDGNKTFQKIQITEINHQNLFVFIVTMMLQRRVLNFVSEFFRNNVTCFMV